MSEATLWDRIRNTIGHRGHFARIEFNPDAGIPDVTYCVKGEEGFIELKYTDSAPARESTAVFTNGGLRTSQVGWIHKRVKVGGRVWILPQIGDELLLIPGRHCRVFNGMTLHLLRKAASWSASAPIGPGDWEGLLDALKERG